MSQHNEEAPPFVAPRIDRRSLEDVQAGIDRFMHDYRTSFGTDCEPEMDDPTACVMCGEYPAAYQEQCFQCLTAGRLRS